MDDPDRAASLARDEQLGVADGRVGDDGADADRGAAEPERPARPDPSQLGRCGAEDRSALRQGRRDLVSPRRREERRVVLAARRRTRRSGSRTAGRGDRRGDRRHRGSRSASACRRRGRPRCRAPARAMPRRPGPMGGTPRIHASHAGGIDGSVDGVWGDAGADDGSVGEVVGVPAAAGAGRRPAVTTAKTITAATTTTASTAATARRVRSPMGRAYGRRILACHHGGLRSLRPILLRCVKEVRRGGRQPGRPGDVGTRGGRGGPAPARPERHARAWWRRPSTRSSSSPPSPSSSPTRWSPSRSSRRHGVAGAAAARARTARVGRHRFAPPSRRARRGTSCGRPNATACSRPSRAPGRPSAALERRALVVAVHGARGGAGCTFVATHLARAIGARDVPARPDRPRPRLRRRRARARRRGRGRAHDRGPRSGRRRARARAPGGGPLARRAPRPAGGGGRCRRRRAPAPRGRGRGRRPRGRRRPASALARSLRSRDGRSRPPTSPLHVVTLDALAFRATARAIDLLGVGEPRIVVNRAGRSEIVVGDVRRVFGVDPFGVVGHDAAVAAGAGPRPAARRRAAERRVRSTASRRAHCCGRTSVRRRERLGAFVERRPRRSVGAGSGRSPSRGCTRRRSGSRRRPPRGPPGSGDVLGEQVVPFVDVPAHRDATSPARRRRRGTGSGGTGSR